MKGILARFKPIQLLTLGFLSYVLIGTILLCLPFSQQRAASVLDNLFSVVSAVSTTGLTTVSVSGSYTFFGELVLLGLFQLGGIGYMTLTSFILLSRQQPLSVVREGVLKTEFALPAGLSIRHFVVQVVWFTLIIETFGALLLWRHFTLVGVSEPLWSAVFHSVSAFATAGFSLYDNSLVDFAGNPMINFAIGSLCYLGALGFIVLQDAWLSARLVERRLTLTSTCRPRPDRCGLSGDDRLHHRGFQHDPNCRAIAHGASFNHRCHVDRRLTQWNGRRHQNDNGVGVVCRDGESIARPDCRAVLGTTGSDVAHPRRGG